MMCHLENYLTSNISPKYNMMIQIIEFVVGDESFP